MSLNSLCRLITKPPLLQVKEWEMSKEDPQVHFEDSRLIVQQYLNLKASQNSCCVRKKPISSSGRVVSHFLRTYYTSNIIGSINSGLRSSWILI